MPMGGMAMGGMGAMGAMGGMGSGPMVMAGAGYMDIGPMGGNLMGPMGGTLMGGTGSNFGLPHPPGYGFAHLEQPMPPSPYGQPGYGQWGGMHPLAMAQGFAPGYVPPPGYMGPRYGRPPSPG